MEEYNKKYLKELKKTVSKKNRDNWTDGTVIKWMACGKFQYAVLKAGGSWWITGQYNYYGKRIFSYDELIEILSLSEVNDIQVSDTWMYLEDA